MRAGLSHDDFWSLTPREVQAAIDAASWRANEWSKLALTAGWTAAILERQKRIPSLGEFLGLGEPARRHRQTPEAQRAIILDIAQSLGLTVERHDTPVI